MLKVNHIQCYHDDQRVIEDVSFHVNSGEMSCLLGPSGCGKTTVLRVIAGFQPLVQGEVTLNNTLFNNSHYQLEPEHRNIGMVFQDYALFPHLSVRNNIHFGIQKLPQAEQKQRVQQLLKLIKLDRIADRYPHELSGGQQQRVALARALATQPQLLLLDEPFSNLDVDLRRHLAQEVRAILQSYGTSAILVTHDQEEAFAFADNIGLLQEGKLQQWDSPYNLFHHPRNRLAANFIGQGNFIKGLIVDPQHIKTELGLINSHSHGFKPQTTVDVLLRPDDISLSNSSGVFAKVTSKSFLGNTFLYTLTLESGATVDALIASKQNIELESSLQVVLNPEQLIAFPSESEKG